MTQLYCTADELIADLQLQRGVADTDQLLHAIRKASDFLARQIGLFTYVIEQRTFDGSGAHALHIDPLLSLTAFDNDGSAVLAADLTLYPLSKHWQDGCYSKIAAAYASGIVFSAEPASLKITGKWGMTYSTLVLTQVKTLQSDSSTTLVVKDGSAVSVGSVLEIGTELEAVLAVGDAVAATSTLSADIDTDDEQLTVTTGSEFSAGEVIRIGVEDIRLDRRNSNVWAVQRGWNSTLIAAHTSGAAISVLRSFTVQRGLNGTTAAAHAADAVVYKLQIPGDVHALARQIAALEFKIASTGFSGREGGGELGEVNYYHEYPQTAIKLVKANYRIVRI
jgi:hypothetical protein